jgi:hypothetical protein
MRSTHVRKFNSMFCYSQPLQFTSVLFYARFWPLRQAKVGYMHMQTKQKIPDLEYISELQNPPD